MTDYIADTHALIWYLEDSDELGSEADAAVNALETCFNTDFNPPGMNSPG